MPTRRKSKTAKKEKKAPENEPKNIEVGTVHEEIEAPCASEVIFRKIWRIRKFHKTIGRRDMIDSPVFRCSVNGMTTFWNIAVRFWKGDVFYFCFFISFEIFLRFPPFSRSGREKSDEPARRLPQSNRLRDGGDPTSARSLPIRRLRCPNSAFRVLRNFQRRP